MDFEAFAQSQKPKLLRYATVLTGDPHQAEDIVQDALVRLYVKWRRVSKTDRPELYARRVVTHEFLAIRRRKATRLTVLQRDPDDVRHDPDHGEQAADRDEMSLLLNRLPYRQRAVLVLRYYEGFTDKEIAELLRCSVGTVYSHASSGLAALRRIARSGSMSARRG